MNIEEQFSFIETIEVFNGHFTHPLLHLKRMKDTLEEMGATGPKLPVLTDEIIPSDMKKEKVKCRILYNTESYEISYSKYSPKHPQFLKLVYTDDIDYHLKYADRSELISLLKQKENCDDILIVKKGEITDTSYSNVILYDGKQYITPRSFLLNGTRRQLLLSQKTIHEEKITPHDLKRFKSLYLINAMLDLKDNISLPTTHIL